jgi:hypothetical protein
MGRLMEDSPCARNLLMYVEVSHSHGKPSDTWPDFPYMERLPIDFPDMGSPPIYGKISST